MKQLKVLETADFNWVKLLDNVWSDDDTDVAGIHGEVRKNFGEALNKLATQKDSASPLGWVIASEGGSGKTHLLGNFRRTTLAKGGFFALVDMSGVRDFWETVLLHLVKSLHAAGSDGRRQIMGLLDRIAKASHCDLGVDGIPGMFRDDLAAVGKKFLNGLFRAFAAQTQEFQDVLRAVVMLASEDFDISNSGWRWLLGSEPDDETVKTFGFNRPVCDAKNAVAGISWLMSLDGGVFVLAFDQLDGILKQY